MEYEIALAIFEAINQSRAYYGLNPLSWNQALVNCAYQHNVAMYYANALSHQLPGEADLGSRERIQGVNWFTALENVGVTNNVTLQGGLALHEGMMSELPPSDGHRQNILTTICNSVGVSIVIANGLMWLTEDFAQV